jgi:predicted ATPase
VITRIEIDGFKSFVDFELELKPFTVLAGANNSGKSNVLEAILLLKSLSSGDVAAFFRRSRGGSAPLFHRASEGTRYAEFHIGVDCVGVSERTVLRVWLSRDGRAVEFAFLPLGSDRSHLAEQSASWLAVNPVPVQMRLGADIADNLPLAENGENLAAVVARIGADEGFEDFRRDAVYVLPQLSDVRAVDFGSYSDLRLTMRGNRVFSPAEVSDGTLRVLAILAALHDPNHPAVLLIEELENGLDPRYLGRLVQRILARLERTDRVQVIVTTHSPVLVAEAKRLSPESVYLLGMVSGPREYPEGPHQDFYTHARNIIAEGERGTFVPPPELNDYLSPVSGL